MGMDIHTYIGPFLEVTGEKVITVDKISRQCPKHPGKKDGNAKFCSICGAEIKNVPYTERATIEPWEAMSEKFDEKLYSPDGIDAFIPNKMPPASIEIDAEQGGVADLTDIEARKKKHIEWFKKTYSKKLPT